MTNEISHANWEEIASTLNVERQKYNEVRGQYATLASEAALAFDLELNRNITKLEQLVEHATNLASPHIFNAIDQAIKTLVEYNILDIDRMYFFKTYYQKYDLWTAAMEKLIAMNNEIARGAEERQKTQADQKNDHAPVIGGGFGLEGAAKGIAIATAANLAIGAASAAADLVKRGLDTVNDNAKRNAVFRDPSTKPILVNALSDSILNVHLALLDALESLKATTEFQRVTVVDQEKAQRMLSNLQQGLFGHIDAIAVLKDILTLNPYCRGAYVYALSAYGDESGGLTRTSTFFHIDLIEEKKALIQPLIKSDSEADVIASIEAIKRAGKRLDISVENDFLSPLNLKLQKFDVEARTVSGVLLPTRDDARRRERFLQVERAEKRKEAAVAVQKIGKFLLYCVLGLVGLIVFIIFISALKAITKS